MDFIMGSVRKSVVSQRDVLAALGYSRAISNFSIGATAKYLSSELVETEKASTMALDFGGTYALNEGFRLAAAYQNLGANLKYANEKSDVPEVARLGAAYALVHAKVPATFLVDFPYLVNESRFDAGLGAEVPVGPIAFRAGYRTGID